MRPSELINPACNAALSSAGLDEWIADNPGEFITAITKLSVDLAELARLREELRKRLAASSLCDREVFVHSIEQAYRAIWCQWCESGE